MPNIRVLLERIRKMEEAPDYVVGEYQRGCHLDSQASPTVAQFPPGERFHCKRLRNARFYKLDRQLFNGIGEGSHRGH